MLVLQRVEKEMATQVSTGEERRGRQTRTRTSSSYYFLERLWRSDYGNAGGDQGTDCYVDVENGEGRKNKTIEKWLP